MPTSNAQRQAAFHRHLQSDDGEGVRLNLIIGTHAKCALERLAGAHGLTQRAMLERLLVRPSRARSRRFRRRYATDY